MSEVDALLIGGAILAVIASGFFSGTEMGVYALNGLRLRVASIRGHRGAKRLLPLVERFETLVVAALIGTNIADYAAAACVTALFLRQSGLGTSAELLATVIVTPAILVFGNIIPKDRYRRSPNELMTFFSLPLVVVTHAARLTGLPWALGKLSQGLLQFIDPVRAEADRNLLPRARFLKLLREGAERGGLTTFQRDVFENVMGLSRTRVANVMIPRGRTAMVPEDIDRADLVRVARMAHFSRLPVYRKTPRNVIGVVAVFDVLADESQESIAEHTRPILKLRTSDTVPVALRRLQRANEVMAVVVDQREECVGLLTIKDLVEEIVGDLEAW
jgi:CBS domain containing-hemolysin-like protein